MHQISKKNLNIKKMLYHNPLHENHFNVSSECVWGVTMYFIYVIFGNFWPFFFLILLLDLDLVLLVVWTPPTSPHKFEIPLRRKSRRVVGRVVNNATNSEGVNVPEWTQTTFLWGRFLPNLGNSLF